MALELNGALQKDTFAAGLFATKKLGGEECFFSVLTM